MHRNFFLLREIFCHLLLTERGKKNIIEKLNGPNPGVAQLVARMVRVHEAVGSNPATRTK